MKLFSWNVNMYIKGAGDMITRAEHAHLTIKNESPDILLLQEASDYFLSYLTEYKEQARVTSHGGLVVILTKGTVTVTNPMKHSNFAVSVNVGDILLVNYHLCPFAQNQEMRDIQISSLARPKCILMGDTNMNAFQHFVSDTIKDVARQIGNNEDTWFMNFFTRGSNVARRFDRVYTDVKVSNFHVYRNYWGESDHIPISVEL
jgi:endonuclease/exonuclease/phosphatase family metal-dependent hydrolase